MDSSVMSTASSMDNRHQSIDSIARILGKRVTRGRDWEWGNQDGGEGNVGTIIKLFLEDPPPEVPCCIVGSLAPCLGGGRAYGGAANTVLVRWDCAPARLYNYRTGYNGKYDLRSYKPTVASQVTPVNEEGPSEQIGDADIEITMFIRATDFRQGEVVRISDDVRRFLNQGTYPDWNPDAKCTAGKMGVVRRSTEHGSVRVTFGASVEYTFPPRLLTKIFQKGDIIRVVSNRAIVPVDEAAFERINKRKARIVDVRSSGQCQIEFLNSEVSERMWLHSNCLVKSRSGASEERKKTKKSTTNAAVINEVGVANDSIDTASSSNSSTASYQHDDQAEMLPSDKDERDDGEPDSKAFFSAVKSGDFGTMSEMVLRNPNLVEAKAERGQSALHLACLRGYVKIIDHLLENGASPILPDDDGDNALHCAVHKNQSNLIDKLIEHDSISLNAQNGLNLTPLHVAVRKRHRASIEILLKRGNLKVNTADTDGDSPLHEALKIGDQSIVNLLLGDHRMERCLLMRNRAGMLPFHIAVSLGNNNFIQTILLYRPDLIAERFADGSTALHIVTLKNNREGLSILLNHSGSDINVKTDRGLTPLHVAAAKSRSALVELLVTKKADLSITDDQNGMTALHYAADRLMRTWTLSDNETAAAACSSSTFPCNYDQLFRLQTIDRADAPMKTYMDACNCEELSILCYLLSRGANPDMKDGRDRNLFDIVVDKTLRPIVERFVVLGRFGSFGNISSAAAASSKLSDSQHCVLCGERECDVTFQPCGDRLVCLACYLNCPSFNRCPRCGKEIKTALGIDGALLNGQEGDATNLMAQLRIENERLKEKTICPICYDREKAVVPACGHSICRECAFEPNASGRLIVPRYLNCPFCRKEIKGNPPWVEIK